jgi:hypothetical protein
MIWSAGKFTTTITTHFTLEEAAQILINHVPPDLQFPVDPDLELRFNKDTNDLELVQTHVKLMNLEPAKK